ncbi:pimeloyl-ACP methyl ester carboxylesterase [Streptosporangium becharense]|uniref:Pimeloyl-ACP methyl ester carboxylesterase n=1 Tax=Streptosporangium becharense TaxID=1816182 RepID=A0A7W9ID95_9ACTN|nr:PKD domain-containing protein [Streptosporangium becharense]MBB2915045.1 pimeloyl-ACP methyl ester carboxylesterase [Streptosporangium becharense]MBB5818094.1 pimeloyl-ACP methyl ester carboxylesterase [Streptosporangium becharense]
MNPLLRSISVKWVAISLSVAVASVLAPPGVARAAPEPEPSRKAETAAPVGEVKFTDLGPASRMSMVGINEMGQVAGTRHQRPVLFSEGSVIEIGEMLPADTVWSWASDINDNGDVVGHFMRFELGDEWSFYRRKNGVSDVFPRPFGRVINNKGQTAGDNWVRDPDGSELNISAFKNQSLTIKGLNDSGWAAGTADMNPDPDVEDVRAFRARPGERLDVNRDRLNYLYGKSTAAYGINDKGQVAGYGLDANGGYTPLIWEPDGRAIPLDTPYGGWVEEINNAGVGVGDMYWRDPRRGTYWLKPAVFLNGVGYYLNDLKPPGYENLDIQTAWDINESGQIVGLAKKTDAPYPESVEHAFILDLGSPKPVIKSITVETRRYPSEDWVDAAPGIGITDGSPMRITVSVENPASHPMSVQLKFFQAPTMGEKVPGTPLPIEPINLDLDPLETVEVRATWKNAALAWDAGGKPVQHRFVKARLYVGAAQQSYAETTGIQSRPKPVVLVHGYKSDAESSWGKAYRPLKDMHPNMGVFAVGDGQFGDDGGTLNTGTELHPFVETNSLDENVDELAKYIENVRERTGAWQVDVVAHSMGGLITRQYIQSTMPRVTDGRPAVNRMLQMGTPNQGTPCANMVMETAMLTWPYAVPYFPATLENTTFFVRDVFNEKYLNLKGAKASNLVGVGQLVPCVSLRGELPRMGDLIVPRWSAQFIYTDVPTTETMHTSMPESVPDLLSYVKPRLAGMTAGGASALAKASSAPVSAQADDGAAGDTDGMSTFATPSVRAEPGQTVSAPLEVPPGEVLGVTGALPSTVGLVLRDPSGKAVAQYAAGSEAAKQPIQGLSVADPQAGAWKLEVTNTGGEPVTANVGAWVAGNPVKVSVTRAEQSSDEGRVRVVAAVSDDGRPVTGVPVRAILLAADGTRHEVALKDDGGSDDGAADDGVYGAVSEPLADGVHMVLVKADTAKGMRTARDVVEVKKPDLREFELSLSAQPGGSVSASPARDTYRAGTTVTLTATADAGRIPVGWTVDGEERPAGALKIVMDGPHTVVARFGTYTVTELGGAAGRDPSATEAVALNDRGQVAATVTWRDGGQRLQERALRWQGGVFTELGGVECADTDDRACGSRAMGINQAGDVAGYAVASVDGGNQEHAVVFRGDGSVTDLQPGSQGSPGRALDVNDRGQVFGRKDGRWVMWDRGIPGALPDTPPFHAGAGGLGSSGSLAAARINTGGAVAGAYVNDTSLGIPVSWAPAVHRDGATEELPGLAVEGRDCATPLGVGYDINTAGAVVGSWACHRLNSEQHAVVWRDGRPTDLGVGVASAVNDGGLVAGLAQGASKHDPWVPALWLDGETYKLADLLPRPMCPKDLTQTTAPCMGLRWVFDVNSSGQILAQGFVRDRDASGPTRFTEKARSFLLTPTTARADLEVTHSGPAVEPAPGAKATWTATVTNKGDDPATDVRLDVLIPQGVTGATCDTWRGACAAITGGFRNTVKVLEPGWSATVEVTAAVASGTVVGTDLKTEAHGYSLAVPDPERGNDIATATVTVRPLLDKAGIAWAEPVRVGSSSDQVPVKLTNRLGAPMPLRVISADAPFAQTNDCPVELPVGASCTVQVTFSPAQAGAANGKLAFFTGEDAEPTYWLPLTGQGAPANAVPVVQAPSAPLRGTAGRPFTLSVSFTDADTEDTHTAVVLWGGIGPGSAEVKQEAGGGTVEATHTFTEPAQGIAVVQVTDSKGDTGRQTVPFLIEEAAPNAAPTVTAGTDVELSVGEKLQRTVTFTDPDSTSWTATVDYGDGAGPHAATLNGQEFALEHQWDAAGVYPVTVKVKDDGGLEATATFTATVKPIETPNQPPAVTLTGPGTAVEGAVWTTQASFTDADSASWTATVDYGDGKGPGKLEVDGGKLRLDHTPADDGGRTITVAVTDDKGATGTATLAVNVYNAVPAVTLKEPVVAAVVPVGTPMSLNASFTDTGSADSHTAVWTIGGQQVAGAVSETGGTGTVSGSHVFTKAGRYPVSVTVTDDDGGATTADSIDREKTYVIVYDPAKSLVGAGWTTSPAGVCTLNAKCAREGRATFHVAARYRRKDDTPTGELHYNVPGFDLRDTSYTVLAAADRTAILRGTGTVNKTTKVTYEVTAIDTGKPVDRSDRLMIRVWNIDGELIYDNSGKAAPVIGIIRVSD